MPDKKIMDLTELTEAPASGDYFPFVDVSDTTDDPEGTNKRIKTSYLGGSFYLSNFDTFKDAVDTIETAGGGTLVLDGGTWEFSNIERNMPSDITMICTSPTTIKVPDGVASSAKLFYWTAEDNICISDPMHVLTLDGNRANRADDVSEFGANLQFNGCNNIYLDVGLSQNAHGDGLYLGANHTEGRDYCNNVVIPYFDSYNSFRQGFGFIGFKNARFGMLIGRGNDQAGIDLEPNYSYNLFDNVHIESAFCYDNGTYGFVEGVNRIDKDVVGKMTINQVVCYNNGSDGYRGSNSAYDKVAVDVNSIKTYNNQQAGVYLDAYGRNTHIGSIVAFNNGQVGLDNSRGSGVSLQNSGYTAIEDLRIDSIFAYDNQDTPTQTYPLAVNSGFASSNVFIGSVHGTGNIHKASNACPAVLAGGVPYTATQIAAITNLQEGVPVFDTTNNKMMFYNGTGWETVTSA